DDYRSFNLDEQSGPNAALITVQGGQFTFNLQPDTVKVKTMASLSWAPYQYDGQSWSGYPMELYWDELARRYAAEFALAYPDAEEAGGALGLAQTYYVALYRGIVNIVQTGDLVLQRDYFGADKPIGASFAGGGRTGAMFVARILASNLLETSQAL